MAAQASLPVRGRDAQLAVVDERLTQARDGRGSVVIIEGGPGLGKTRMLQAACASAGRMAFRIGRGMADPIDSVVEFAPLIEALFEHEPPLVDRAALGDARPGPEQRYWVLQDIQHLLEQAARRDPLLICLDDMQWTDNGTAAALRLLPPRLASLPVAWFVTTRPGQGSAQLVAALDGLVAVGADVLRLRPLDQAAVAQIVTDILRANPDADLLRRAERIEGNPFLLVELVRGLVEEKIVAVDGGRARMTEDRLPSRVSDDMRRRLARLPEPAERVATSAASLGRRFTVADLATMSDLSVPELLSPIRTLLQADILTEFDDRLAFGHDLVRDAVRASVPIAVRRAFDRRGADVLLARGALPVEVAKQLAASAEPGDEVAIATLADAAEALAATDPASSAELAARALALTPTQHRRRGPLVSRRAISLFAAGLGEEAKQFADTVLRQALPSEQEAQVRLSIASMFGLSPDVRVDNARQALVLPDLPADLRAWLDSVVLHNLVVAGRTEQARNVAPQARTAAEASTSVEARFAVELAQAGLDYQMFRFQSALDRLDAAAQLRTTEDVRARLAHYFRCWILVALDRFDEALAVADNGMVRAQRDRQSWALHIFETWKGLQALQTGRLADAAPMLEGRFSRSDAHLIVGIIDAASVGGLGRLKIHTGDERGAREISQIAKVMLQTTAPSVRRHAVWHLAAHAMATGKPHDAHEQLCALGDTDRLSIFPLFPHDVANDPELIRIALAVGDDELTIRTVAAAEERHRLNPGVRSLQACAAHVRGLARRSPDDLETAAALFRNVARPLALASALEDLGRLRVDDGATRDAVDSFDQALTVSAEAGASWDAARIRGRLRRLGVRRRIVAAGAVARSGWDALTPAERQVAQLVGEGKTNREIGEQLFVSPHTVSAHLRRIFDKLAVRSRGELIRANLSEVRTI
jgi:DNA-binding CsgD family transcriptional regulator/tetratricopeptide (TPR) repeat protein